MKQPYPVKVEFLGRCLKEKMQDEGVGIRGAAALIGCSPTTVSRMTRDEIPDVPTAKKVARWLECDFLISGDKT